MQWATLRFLKYIPHCIFDRCWLWWANFFKFKILMEECAPQNGCVFINLVTFNSNLVYSAVWNQSKQKENLVIKTLLQKDSTGIDRKGSCNYRDRVRILSYLQGSTHPWLFLANNQCTQFSNNTRLIHKRVVSRISKYLENMSTYMNLLDGTCPLFT